MGRWNRSSAIAPDFVCLLLAPLIILSDPICLFLSVWTRLANQAKGSMSARMTCGTRTF